MSPHGSARRRDIHQPPHQPLDKAPHKPRRKKPQAAAGAESPDKRGKPSRADGQVRPRGPSPRGSAGPAGVPAAEPHLMLYLHHGPESVGYLSVLLPGAEDLEIEVLPSKIRVLLALREALREDVANTDRPESARGWRSPLQISELVDAQTEWQPRLSSRTVRSYVSSIHRAIQTAAARKGVDKPPEVFERRRKKGIRLAYPLLVIDQTGTIDR